jgi:molybdopterin-guanine dinucleotide biosynthesis protein B
MHEVGDGAEATLTQLLQRASPCDLILIEGFKTERHVKMEVFRVATGKTALHPQDRRIVAIASDHAFPDAGVPVVDLNNIAAVADLIYRCASPLQSTLAALASA